MPALQGVIAQKSEQLYEEMKNLALEHPELLEALVEADEAQERFRAERERRCEGRLLFCRR